jgi:hypothetical protein
MQGVFDDRAVSLVIHHRHGETHKCDVVGDRLDLYFAEAKFRSASADVFCQPYFSLRSKSRRTVSIASQTGSRPALVGVLFIWKFRHHFFVGSTIFSRMVSN